MRLLSVANQADLDVELTRVGADPLSWPIFRAKSRVVAIKVDCLSTATANILKQTAMACGGDCAVNRLVVSGRVRRTDAILFLTKRQLQTLGYRLADQPECVARLVPELSELVGNLQSRTRSIKLGRKTLDLGRRTYVMGILNVTPDSFSDGGRFLEPSAAVEHALSMAEEGADFIDIGAESTRPGSRPVPVREQQARLLPVLRAVKKRLKTPVSVDTTSATVTSIALSEGADIVNDVSAFAGDRQMAVIVARAGVPCILMHMKGRPRTMQKKPEYSDLMAEVTDFLAEALRRGEAAGIARTQMLVDPGIGFGKTVAHNLEILRRLAELESLGAPVVVGPSRKRFIGAVSDSPPGERVEGTIAACVLAARNGANVLRVHDVKPVVKALKLADAVEMRA
ncbi:dihydropteroate synthase [candidate division WOR-3 bacterium]|uniref:Dihydropteroate synthase n=1 Tax=candidate division WOR-3 bacterium TaxID=2052148 RepID=A0A937XGG1_UNCW3|nr:dihydropteroate synthase [candidate division WOR-3 bacterium]